MKATMPYQPRSAALALTLTLLAAGALLTACGGGDKAAGAKASAPQAAASAAPRAALTVTTARPSKRTLAQEVGANGNVAAWQEASVGADVQALRIADAMARFRAIRNAGARSMSGVARLTPQGLTLEAWTEYGE